jgi:hypothetical protein
VTFAESLQPGTGSASQAPNTQPQRDEPSKGGATGRGQQGPAAAAAAAAEDGSEHAWASISLRQGSQASIGGFVSKIKVWEGQLCNITLTSPPLNRFCMHHSAAQQSARCSPSSSVLMQ